MSEAKKFAFKSPLSAEERLDEIERKYGVIQERIQAYDEVLAQFSAIQKDLKQSKQNTASLHDFLDSFSKEMKSAHSSFLAQIQPLKSIQDSHSKSLQAHDTTISSMLEHASNMRNESKSAIEQLNSKVGGWANEQAKICSFLEEIKRKISEIVSQQSAYIGNLEKLYADYFKFKDNTESSQTSLNKEIRKAKQAIDEAPDLVEWANKVYTRIQSDLTYRDRQATSYVDKKVDEVAQNFAADPLSAESIKAALFNEIQSVALDSKNAYLKSNNCAQQIQLLEKKLENLNLIIKKYELNK